MHAVVAFTTLKEKLVSQPVLILLDPFKPFEIQCDACGDCLGAVLLQDNRAMAYEIHQLHEKERVLGISRRNSL